MHIIRSGLVFILLLFLIGFIYAIYTLISNKPLAVLSQEGIWIHHYNFIPWQDIAVIDSYTMPGMPLQVIGIRFYDIKKNYAAASLSGKIAFFWAKLFDYPFHITLSNVGMDHDQLLCFVKRYSLK